MIKIKISLKNNITNSKEVVKMEIKHGISKHFIVYNFNLKKSICDIEFGDSILNQEVDIFHDNYDLVKNYEEDIR